MYIIDLINPDRIRCIKGKRSKKRALEQLSQLLAESTDNASASDIFDSLVERERLGSTGFGNGVAIPHSRIPGLKEPVAALITLEEAVEFDSLDGEPVDLLFALLVPEQSTEEHLQLLAQLAQIISVDSLCDQLRHTEDITEIYNLLHNQHPANLSA